MDIHTTNSHSKTLILLMKSNQFGKKLDWDLDEILARWM